MSAADKFWIKCLDVASWGRFFARQSDPRPSTPWLGRGSLAASAADTPAHAPAGHSTSLHTGNITNPGFLTPHTRILSHSAPILSTIMCINESMPPVSRPLLWLMCSASLGWLGGWAGGGAGLGLQSRRGVRAPAARPQTGPQPHYSPASATSSERPFSHTKTLYLISSYTYTHVGTWQM